MSSLGEWFKEMGRECQVDKGVNCGGSAVRALWLG